MNTQKILQSPNDLRTYQPMRLDNGLTVLLVEQKDSEKSAASLTVNVGHFDDPKEREGLAHFLEHMLFLGSENFPKAGEYQQFISQYGGSHNAWTGTEHSSFFFDIENAYFPDVLARFADMFAKPLFSSDYVDKERHAIDAEFSLKLKDDARRIYQVHKETINPLHPFAKFSVGNLNTLADTKTRTLQEDLVAFFKQQYSTSRMTLTLVSPLCIKEQEALVNKYFNALPSHLEAKAPLSEPLYLKEHQGIQLNILPHKDSQKLVVSFAFPDIQKWYPYKIITFISHLLGDEGEGSLLSYLKNKGLVNHLHAGGGIDGSNYKDFSIAFDLTNAGVHARDEILMALFSAIERLKQSPFPLELFKERQKLLTWSYLYQEPSNALQTANNLSVNLQHYPLHDVIFGDYRMELPEPSLYEEVLNYFNAHNMRIMLIASSVKTDKEARWYHTPYSVEVLPKALLEKLAQATTIDEIQLSKKNPYLEGDIALLAKELHMPIPKVLISDDNFSLWYKTDTDFNTPKGHIFVQLSLPQSVQDLNAMAATRLWVELFLDNVNQEFYAATAIGLSYHLHVQRQGISIHTSGLSSNQLLLLEQILQKMTAQQFNEARFVEIKHQLSRLYINSSKNKPVSRLFSQLSALLQPLSPEADELAQALDVLSFKDFIAFDKTLLQQVHIESLLVGNWNKAHAEQLKTVLQKWQASLVSKGLRLNSQTYSLQGKGPVWLNVDTKHNEHAHVVYLGAKNATPKKMALYMLLNHVLSPQYFHELRTEQQLGYLVGTGYVPVNTLPGIALYVQSPNTACEKLYDATINFFNHFLSGAKSLEQSEFEQIKQTLDIQLNDKDQSLGARAKRMWLALGQQDHSFALSEKISDELKSLTRDEFIEFLASRLTSHADAIYLATDGKPENSPVFISDATELKQKLIQVKCF